MHHRSRVAVVTAALADVRLHSKRFLAAAALIALGAAMLPLPADAATSVVDLLKTPYAEQVKRGDFVKAAVQALNMQGSAKGDQLIDIAKKEGALTAFGNTPALERNITRGEMAQVLYGLTDKTSTVKINYTDVKAGTPLAKAVQAAVGNNWIRPLRSHLFGANRSVNGRDARLVIARVARIPASTVDDTTTAPPVRVQITRTSKRTLPKADVMQTVWELLNDQYLYQDRIKADEAAYKSIEGMVQSLGDPYTIFMRPSSSQNFRNQIQGEVTGIGAQVEQKGTAIIIVTPLKGSPAEKAGLLPGDEILMVDGVSIAGLPFEEAVNKIRGPKGSTVKLRIRRNGSELDFSVVRDIVRIAEVEVSYQENVAIVKIHQFGKVTETELRDVMVKVQESAPKGIVLDLRNNPGGLLHAATIVMSNFVPVGTAVARIEATDQVVIEKTQEAPTISESIPVVVLVNKGSASASEIVAGALQDADRATVVGVTTFGKGTVQQVIQFTDGSALKMTIAEWKTPLGRKIDGVGVIPDIPVQEEIGGRDLPLIKALEILR